MEGNYMRKLMQLMGTVGVIHAGEDIFLMSLGRWLPVPVWLLYVIGITVSTTLLTFIVRHLTVETGRK